MRKIFLLPYFGKYPDWLDKWVANMELLDYDYKIFSNLKLFKQRVEDILGIKCNIKEGTGKVWDYRCALGLLYQDEIKDYDLWGHTDFDCVYGDVDKYMPNEFDIWSNHYDYIMGAWSLYKNNDQINNLFKLSPNWKNILESNDIYGWVEREYTQIANKNAKVVYTFYQTKNLNDFSTLSFKDNKLYEGNEEIMMAHFRRTKQYPNV